MTDAGLDSPRVRREPAGPWAQAPHCLPPTTPPTHTHTGRDRVRGHQGRVCVNQTRGPSAVWKGFTCCSRKLQKPARGWDMLLTTACTQGSGCAVFLGLPTPSGTPARVGGARERRLALCRLGNWHLDKHTRPWASSAQLSLPPLGFPEPGHLGHGRLQGVTLAPLSRGSLRPLQEAGTMRSPGGGQGISTDGRTPHADQGVL